jgi:membrane-associated phospholipid phosphatase
MKRAIPSLFCGALTVVATTRSNAAESLTLDDLWTDTKLYFTSPLRWDTHDWAYVGLVAAVVAGAHQADNRVRRHFAPNPVLDGKDKNSTRDAAPAAAIVFGTWAFAQLEGSQAGRTESYTMLEAAAFSSITAEALKYAAGRGRPNQTLNSDDWRASGSSFPSLHSTAAFAIGTVFAESGSDDFRWTRRILGYGMAGATAYLRLHDNSHWFSDVVAGAAIGASTGIFTLNRRIAHRQRDLDVSVAPAAGGGVALNLRWTLH